jgi:ABC-2 type transport system permease protein
MSTRTDQTSQAEATTRHTPTTGRGTEAQQPRTATRGAWLQVARREVLVKLTDKGFLISTVVTVLLIGAVLAIQGFMQNRTSTFDVVTTDSTAAAMVDRIADRAPDIDDKVAVKAGTESDAAAARAAVQDEKVDAWLQRTDSGWTLVTKDTADSDLSTVVSTVVRETALADNATKAGTTMAALQAGTTVTAQQLDGNAERSGLVTALGFIFAILFYLASIMFGMTLASSVVEEKQSRIVEMIAAAIPLRQLLAGKIIGNTVLAFGQMALYVGVGLVGMSFTDYGKYVAGLSGSIGWFLAFFLVGFVALACLWAVAGALASRTEDIQSTSMPITMLMMLMYFGALFLDGTARAIGSFIPPVSSILMPMRVLAGEVSWWEPALALLLLVAFAVGLILVSERIYRRALLQTGGKLSVKDAWRTQE